MFKFVIFCILIVGLVIDAIVDTWIPTAPFRRNIRWINLIIALFLMVINCLSIFAGFLKG